jgi:hypothetical protein
MGDRSGGSCVLGSWSWRGSVCGDSHNVVRRGATRENGCKPFVLRQNPASRAWRLSRWQLAPARTRPSLRLRSRSVPRHARAPRAPARALAFALAGLPTHLTSCLFHRGDWQDHCIIWWLRRNRENKNGAREGRRACHLKGPAKNPRDTSCSEQSTRRSTGSPAMPRLSMMSSAGSFGYSLAPVPRATYRHRPTPVE